MQQFMNGSRVAFGCQRRTELQIFQSLGAKPMPAVVTLHNIPPAEVRVLTSWSKNDFCRSIIMAMITCVFAVTLAPSNTVTSSRVFGSEILMKHTSGNVLAMGWPQEYMRPRWV